MFAVFIRAFCSVLFSLSRLNFSCSSDVGATCAVLLFVLFTTNEKAKQIYSLSLSLSIRTFLFLVQFIMFAFFNNKEKHVLSIRYPRHLFLVQKSRTESILRPVRC